MREPVFDTEYGQHLLTPQSARLIELYGQPVAYRIRPGYAFNVMVTQDLVFPGPYGDTVRP